MTLTLLPVPPAANDHPPRVMLSDALQAELAEMHASRVQFARTWRAIGCHASADRLLSKAADLRAELSAHGCETLAAKLARDAEDVS